MPTSYTVLKGRNGGEKANFCSETTPLTLRITSRRGQGRSPNTMTPKGSFAIAARDHKDRPEPCSESVAQAVLLRRRFKVLLGDGDGLGADYRESAAMIMPYDRGYISTGSLQASRKKSP